MFRIISGLVTFSFFLVLAAGGQVASALPTGCEPDPSQFPPYFLDDLLGSDYTVKIAAGPDGKVFTTRPLAAYQI